MTEPASSNFDHPLFARKGLAVPVGLAGCPTGIDEAAPGQGAQCRTPPDSASEKADAAAQDSGQDDKASTPTPPASLFICEPFIGDRRGSAAGRISAADKETETDAAMPITVPGAVAKPTRRADQFGWLRHCVAASVVLAGLFAIYWVTRPDQVAEIAAPADPATTAISDTPVPIVAAGPVRDAPGGYTAKPGSSPEGAPPVETTITPSFDIVRFEADGTAVLAGQAMPNSELIVLDNGEPIGATSADWTGEWVLVPDRPLDEGDHEFSLVVKTEHGKLTLSAKPRAAKTGGESGDGIEDPEARLDRAKRDSGLPAAPVPAAKPDPPARVGPGHATADRRYEVQIASLATAAEADLEISRLQRLFPELLARRKLRVDEAELPDRRRFFRIRTGPFDDPLVARELCSRFEIKRQDCLVIRH